MLVKATRKYEELHIKDNELNRIPKEGEEFEVTKERYEILTRTNRFHKVFVEKVEQVKEIEIETATEEVKTETAIKKARKKKENDI